MSALVSRWDLPYGLDVKLIDAAGCSSFLGGKFEKDRGKTKYHRRPRACQAKPDGSKGGGGFCLSEAAISSTNWWCIDASSRWASQPGVSFLSQLTAAQPQKGLVR
jgi:hypothetical protein